VRATAIDAAGGVWVCGLGGASWQDPKSLAWKSYGEADGLLSVAVQAVAVAHDGDVWFGTSIGASRFDPRSGAFKSYTVADGLSDNDVRAVATTSNGDVWFGTARGASRFDPRSGKFQSYRPLEGKSSAVQVVAEATDGGIWLHGARLLEPKSGKFAAPPEPLASAAVRGIAQVRAGAVWFATGAGAILLDQDARSVEGFAAPAGPVDADIRALAAGPSGKVWFATAGGVALFEPESRRWRSFSAEAGLADDDVTAIAIDPVGSVWFGTRSGVSRFDAGTGAWRIWSHADGLVDNRVSAVAPGPTGKVWVGTRRGLSIVEPVGGLVSSLANQDELMRKTIKSIAFDATGATWFGTTSGVSRMAPGARSAAAPDRLLALLANDAAGRVWAGMLGEVLALDPVSQTWSSIKDPDFTGSVLTPLLAFAIGPTGQAWFGTIDGARYFEPAKSAWRSLAPSDGLVNGHVDAVAFEPTGAVWLGTPGGASRFDPLTNGWQTLTSADGLAADDVGAIAVEPAGAVWFGTTAGVTRFDSKSGSMHTFRRDFRAPNDTHPLLASTGTRTLVGRGGRLSIMSGSELRTLEPVPPGARAIAVAPGPTDDSFWIGTELGGLTLRGGVREQQLVSKAGLPDMTVRCLSTLTGAPQNLVWVGTDAGVALVERGAPGLRVVRQAPQTLPRQRADAIQAVGPGQAYVAFNGRAPKAGTPPSQTELWYIDGERATSLSPPPDEQANWAASPIAGLSWSAQSRRLWVGSSSGLFVADDHGLRRATANAVELRLPISAITVQNVRTEPGRELVWIGLDARAATAARLLRFDPARGELLSIAGLPAGKRFEALSLSPAREIVVMVDGKLARGRLKP
jgi:ligand-binding sensor domain-containing protein